TSALRSVTTSRRSSRARSTPTIFQTRGWPAPTRDMTRAASGWGTGSEAGNETGPGPAWLRWATADSETLFAGHRDGECGKRRSLGARFGRLGVAFDESPVDLLLPAHIAAQFLGRAIDADRHRKDARQVGVGQSRRLLPFVHLRLDRGQLLLRCRILTDVEARIAQCGHHVLRDD